MSEIEVGDRGDGLSPVARVMAGLPVRDEFWTRDGRTAHIPVRHDNVVEVAYEALAQLMLDAGFVRTKETP